MRKKKLGELPIKTRETTPNYAKWTLEAELYDEDKVLNINAYFRNNTSPNYRVFIHKDEYVTQDLQGPPTWRKGRLVHYVGYEYWDRDRKDKVYADEKFKKIICDYIEIQDEDIINAISRFQDKILRDEILKQEKRITDPIDKKMEEIKDLPADWIKWLEDDVFIKSRYIYYQFEKHVNMKGFCTHCKSEVTIYKPKHNANGICPACGSNIIYKAIGKSTQVSDKRNVALLQKTTNGFVVRYFSYWKDYHKDYKNTVLTFNEIYRDFYDKKLNLEAYDYGLFKNKYNRWNRGGEMHYGNNEYNLYPYNIKPIVAGTKLEYSDIGTLAGNRIDFKFNVDGFIRHYKSGAIHLEHFIKVGLFNLVRGCIDYYSNADINVKGKNLNAVLGIKNDDIKILIEADITSEALKLFKEVRKQGKRLTAEQLIEIMDNYRVDTFENIFRYAPIIRTLKYLSQLSIKDKVTLYSDYLNTCVKLNQDIKNSFVLFPNDLKTAHDVNVEIINEKNRQAEYKRQNKAYAAIKSMKNELNDLYFYENDKFFIRAPEDAAEIVKEGQSLHHCVGGGYYSQKMANKQIAILFLRDKEKPDASYYTLEIDRDTNVIKQCHGYRNEDEDKKKIESFITKFKKEKLSKLKEIIRQAV